MHLVFPETWSHKMFCWRQMALPSSVTLALQGTWVRALTFWRQLREPHCTWHQSWWKLNRTTTTLIYGIGQHFTSSTIKFWFMKLTLIKNIVSQVTGVHRLWASGWGAAFPNNINSTLGNSHTFRVCQMARLHIAKLQKLLTGNYNLYFIQVTLFYSR